jgi:hypothetical protein
MTRVTPRLRWQQALKAAPFSASQRTVKATLLTLVDLMAVTGELEVWREEMVQATGLPPRTLDRHLHRAVEDGWLVRAVPGGHGRRSLYRAVIPASCAPSVAHNVGSCAPPTRTQPPAVVRHPAANSREKSANVSERVAVDPDRGRRAAPVGSGVSATEYIRKSSSYQGWVPTPVAAGSPDCRGRVV